MPKRKALSKDEVDDLINDLRKARARHEPDVAKPGEFVLAAPSTTKDVRQSTSTSADMVAGKFWPHMPLTAALADDGERPFSIVVSDALQIQVPSMMGALQSDAIADALSRGDSLLRIPDASISAAALTQVHAHLYGRDIACASFQDAVDLLRAAQTLRMHFLGTAALGSVRLLTKPENALEALNWIQRFGTGEELEQCRVYVVRNLDAVSRTEQWCRLSWTEIEAWVHEARAASTPTAQILHCFLRWICNTSRKFEKEEVSALLCALPVSSTDRTRLTSIFAKMYQAVQNSPKSIVERLALVKKCMERTTTSWSFLVDVALRQNRKLLLTSKLWKPIQTLHVPLLGLSLIAHEHSFFTFGGMQESRGPAGATAFPRVQMRDLFPALAHRTAWPISSGSMSLDSRLRPTWPSQDREQDAGHHRLVSSQRQDLRIVDAATTVAQHHFGVVAGGCDAETGKTLASVSAFILDTKEWVNLPPLPRPRVAACAGWLRLQRNRSYVLVITAGCDEKGHADASTLGLEFTCTIEDSKAVWSWATEWRSCSALAEARFAAGTCVIAQDTMVVVGGLASNASETLASVEILRVPEHVKSFEDLALIKWAKSTPLPAPLHSMGVFGISGPDEQCRIIVAGGRSSSGKDLADVMQFCLEADSASDWQRMPLELPECRSSFGYTIVDAGAELCLLVAGGVSGSRVLDSVIALVLDFRTTITTPTTTMTPKKY